MLRLYNTKRYAVATQLHSYMHLDRLTDKQRNYADEKVAMIIPYRIEKRIFMLPSDQDGGYHGTLYRWKNYSVIYRKTDGT